MRYRAVLRYTRPQHRGAPRAVLPLILLATVVHHLLAEALTQSFGPEAGHAVGASHHANAGGGTVLWRDTATAG